MYQANSLPAPIDQIDQSTLLQSPQQHQVIPNVQLPPGYDQQRMAVAIGAFRFALQSKLNKGPLQVLTYNLLSANNFSNQSYQWWAQMAVNFTAMLEAVDGVAYQQAVDKSSMLLSSHACAYIYSQYPAIHQYVADQRAVEAIQKALTVFNAVQNDVANWVNQGCPRNTQQMYPQQNFGQMSMNAPVSGQQLPPTGMGGHYMNQFNQRPAQPRPDVRSFTAQPAQVSESRNPPMVSMSTTTTSGRVGMDTQPAQPVVHTEVEPIVGQAPNSVDDIDLNKGTKAPERPYDLIKFPGGVTVVPAHLSTAKRIRGPYRTGYDPSQWVLFHVNWPDGVVDEKAFKWEHDMDYLQHELNQELRGLHTPSNGKVIANTRGILNSADDPKPVEEVAPTIDGRLSSVSNVSPVLIDTPFTSSTDLEAAEDAADWLIAELGLDNNTQYLPAHEYRTFSLYPMTISEDTHAALVDLEKEATLSGVVSSLNRLLSSGRLSMRYYRMLNKRFTDGFNAVLRDNLAQPDSRYIDSFCDDLNDMLNILQKREGVELVNLINKHTTWFVRRYCRATVTDYEEGDRRFCVVDEKVNLQVEWLYEDIAGINLGKHAVLISKQYHPHLHLLCEQMLARNNGQGNQGITHRLITLDGVYLELVSGWLTPGSILLKKLAV